MLELAGREAEAAAALREAIELWELKGAAAEVRRAQERLAAVEAALAPLRRARPRAGQARPTQHSRASGRAPAAMPSGYSAESRISARSLSGGVPYA